MSKHNLKDSNRFITGTVSDFNNKRIENSTVILSVRYLDNYCNECIEKISFTTTNNCGEFVFCVDIYSYCKSEFIIEAFYPIKYDNC